jgi:hypothetical protein
MKTITREELVQVLKGIKHATPITISAITDTRCRKKDVATKTKENPHEKILKFSVVNGFTGVDYEASVQRQELREGYVPAFEAQERKWGENINNCLVTKEDGKCYLAIRPLRSKPPVFIAVNGNKQKRVKKEEIECFLPQVKEAPNQPTEKKIVYRNYLVDNLRSVVLNGVRYEIMQ